MLSFTVATQGGGQRCKPSDCNVSHVLGHVLFLRPPSSWLRAPTDKKGPSTEINKSVRIARGHGGLEEINHYH